GDAESQEMENRAETLADLDQYAPAAAAATAAAAKANTAASSTPGERAEIATFHVGGHWLGLPVQVVQEAVELQGYTRLPGAPAQVFGSMLHRNEAIPLYNLHAALGLPEQGRPEELQVVVIDSGAGRPFGILVDRLGEIPEVPVDHIAPVSNIFVGATPVLASLVKPSDPEHKGAMLTLLSVEHMHAILRDL
ncbi:MAG: chemotaxis protein CheW, partial [Azovibrio sp.]|nr:chemotaxis protein CheW [Azovibrio sp.]